LQTSILIGSVLAAGLGLGFLLAWLWLRAALGAERARSARVPELQQAIAAREAELRELRERLEAERLAVVQTRERLDAERAAAVERLRLVEDAQARLADSFRALSADALRQNNDAFLTLARDVLERQRERAGDDLEARSRAIDALVHPLRDALDKVDTRIRELESTRAEAYGSLSAQVGHLLETQRALREETAGLSRALRTPAVRGRWGELTLRRVVEMAGMVEYCDFQQQATVHTEDGMLRPDMTVRLPNDRRIVVDAKAPLQAYLEALEARDDTARAERLAQHARQIRAHVQKLGAERRTGMVSRARPSSSCCSFPARPSSVPRSNPIPR
jgi:DNA recombination protein RmuC